ncbi:MAG: hypothetical protein ACAI38_07405 [Myxococcota bacterium]|nr:hypothetical protein [Myxococcota bacterium]
MADNVAANTPLSQIQAYAQTFRGSVERHANLAPSEMRGLTEAIASRLEPMSQADRQQFLRDIQSNTDIPQMLDVLRRQAANGRANTATRAGEQLDSYLQWAHREAGIEPPSGRGTRSEPPRAGNDALVRESHQAVREINAAYQPGGRWSIETALQLPGMVRPKP